MTERDDLVSTINEQLSQLLAAESPDLQQCMQLIEQRDQHIAAVKPEHIGRDLLQQSVDINQHLEQVLKKEQAAIEQSLLTINQGKKARASYE